MSVNFCPGLPVEINVGAASANVLVARGNGEIDVRVVNDGSATVWIRAGSDNTVTVTSTAGQATTGIRIRAGETEMLTFRAPSTGTLYIAAIAAGATGKIEFTPGVGI